MISKPARYREILRVLARHDFGVVSDKFIKHDGGDRPRAEHLRQACEELGPLFIKLGQALSTRGDLLPDVYRAHAAGQHRIGDGAAGQPFRAVVRSIRL